MTWPPVLRHTGLLVRRVLLRKQIIPRKYWRGTSNTRPACVVFVYSYATKIGEGKKKKKETHNTHLHTDTLNPTADCFIASTDILNTGQEFAFPHVSCVSWGWNREGMVRKSDLFCYLPIVHMRPRQVRIRYQSCCHPSSKTYRIQVSGRLKAGRWSHGNNVRPALHGKTACKNKWDKTEEASELAIFNLIMQK